MKKTCFVFLLMLGFVLISCQDNTVKEWQQFYDFTLDDIKGTYHYSNLSSAFDGLTENDFCHICEDAQVSVSSYLGSASSIEFKVNCQREAFNKAFTGHPVMSDDSPLLKMTNPTALYPEYELTAYVYRNARGDIRLHGNARHVFYEIVYEDGVPVHRIKYAINYYFDVIKD